MAEIATPPLSAQVADNWHSFWEAYTSSGNNPALCTSVPQRQRTGVEDIAHHWLVETRFNELMVDDENCVLLSMPRPLDAYQSVPLDLRHLEMDVARSDTLVQFRSKYALLFAQGASERFSMSMASALRMLSAPNALQLGNLHSGPSMSMRTTFRRLHWFGDTALSAAGRTVCVRRTVLFLHYLSSMTLPIASDVLRHCSISASTLNGASADDLIATNNFIRDHLIVAMTSAVDAYCAHFTSERTAAHAKDVTAVRDVLNTLTNYYVRWRYRDAPIAAEGARALFAAVCSVEPVLYMGVTVNATSRGFLPEHDLPHYAIETVHNTNDAHTVVSDIATYAKLHYALRIATFFERANNALTLNPTSSLHVVAAACALLLLQRNVALAHVVSQFCIEKRVIGVRDLSAFACDPAIHCDTTPHPAAKLVECLCATRWFGSCTRAIGGRATRSLSAPGLRIFAPNEPAPLSVTYIETDECAYGSEFGTTLRYDEPRHFRRRLGVLHAEHFSAASTRISAHSDTALDWLPREQIYAPPLSRCCVKTVNSVLASEETRVISVPSYVPPLVNSSDPLSAFPALANRPPAEYISPFGASSGRSDATSGTTRDTADFLATALLAHCVAAVASVEKEKQAGEVVSSSSSDNKKKRVMQAQQSGAAKKVRFASRNTVPTSSALAAYIYYTNHCQSTHPGIRVAERQFPRLVTLVNSCVLAKLGVHIDGRDHRQLKRGTCLLSASSPLVWLAKKFRKSAALRRRSGADPTPFIHVIAGHMQQKTDKAKEDDESSDD